MYLNMQYMEKEKFTFIETFILQLAKQQKTEDCTKYLEEHETVVKSLKKRGYLKSIQGKKSDPAISKIRLDKKGKEFLDTLEIAEVTEDDITIFNWIKERYLDMDKKLGNQKKTKLYIALFRLHSGIDQNRLALLMDTFTNDDANMEYNMMLEYALFKPQNAYNTKFHLDESRLYQYYLKHQEYFDQKFKDLE